VGRFERRQVKLILPRNPAKSGDQGVGAIISIDHLVGANLAVDPAGI
jgi:hypothetical protein